jgi:polar amino acid transport system substrate-binding protein
MRLYWIVLFILLSPPLLAQTSSSSNIKKPQKAFFGVSMETSLPFIEIINGSTKPEIKSGILKDLAEALFAELKIEPVLVLLPKKRVGPDLVSGELSIVCYAHESWFPNSKQDLLWSNELTTNTNLIVSLGKKRAKKIEDLYGKNVGTIVNYVYKNLESYFEKNKIYRENGPNNESNIQKLLHGRIDYLILSNMEYGYYKKTHPQLVADDLGMDTSRVKCAVSKKSGINLELLNQAIEKLRASGKLAHIFNP